ncbi:TPA: hypothetical protein DCZ39_08290 [Patescibacteria group bacterium]|nr:hypothetical protein [Candidatus Gracilibacteria bacterium]
MIRIIIATNAHNSLDPDFVNPLKDDNARATHKARTNIWTIEILKGQIVKVIPASNPLLIFFGYTTFIDIKRQLKDLEDL